MLLAEWNTEDAIAVAREEGRDEGIEEGQQKRDKEIAKKMKARGDSIDSINDITGLSFDEIVNL